MKKDFFKYIEGLIFLLIFIGLIMWKLNKSYSYLAVFSLGKFFYLALIYSFARVFIAFVQNKMLKYILRTRLNALVLLILLIENVTVIFTIENYGYQDFFVTGLEKYNSGALFVSFFGRLYDYIPKNGMLSLLGILISYLFIYVTGKIIGYINRIIEKRKNGEYYRNKEFKKSVKEREKLEKLERKTKKRKEKLLETEEESLNSSEEDFIVDIKKEFKTMLHHKDEEEKNIIDEKRKKIQEDIRERHELKRTHKENNVNEETQITFLKEENLNGKLFEEEKENISMKNFEQKTLITYPIEHVELSKVLGVSLEKLARAIELIHKEGIKGSVILEKELKISSDEAERIYARVKKLKEY